jgi:ketosteroid isomerase-like protein
MNDDARRALAERFVAALATPDTDALAAILAPDARFWVNIGPSEYDRTERLALLALEHSHLATLEMAEVRIQTTAEGFVVEAVTVATTSDGVSLAIPVCLVVDVRDGRVGRVAEYADSADAAPLLRAMSGGRP